MSYRVLALGVAVLLGAGSSGAFAQSSTIRIEPRPVYGATVTIEEGVRVFRPLPPDKYVIVNPNGTPVNLGDLADERDGNSTLLFQQREQSSLFRGPMEQWLGLPVPFVHPGRRQQLLIARLEAGVERGIRGHRGSRGALSFH